MKSDAISPTSCRMNVEINSNGKLRENYRFFHSSGFSLFFTHDNDASHLRLQCVITPFFPCSPCATHFNCVLLFSTNERTNRARIEIRLMVRLWRA